MKTIYRERTIYQEGNYRIVEHLDDNLDMEQLKGDCFDPKANPECSPEKLKAEEKAFESKVHDDQVWGYILQKWDPSVDAGWESLDGCCGFVGRHKHENHYIVDELKAQIKEDVI